MANDPVPSADDSVHRLLRGQGPRYGQSPGFWIAAYALAVSVGSATLIITRQRLAAGTDQDVGAVLAWQLAAYGSWLPVAVIASAIFRRWFFTQAALIRVALLGVAALLCHALLVAALDLHFSRDSVQPLMGQTIGRLPIDILGITALICATALLALYRQHRVLAEALDAVRHIADARPHNDLVGQLLVFVGRGRVPVAVELIESVAAAGNYVVVTWLEREGLLRETLSAIAERLDPAVFVRVHRSTIVNLTKVARATPLADGSWRLKMLSGAEVIVSRRYRDAILARLGSRRAEANSL